MQNAHALSKLATIFKDARGTCTPSFCNSLCEKAIISLLAPSANSTSNTAQEASALNAGTGPGDLLPLPLVTSSLPTFVGLHEGTRTWEDQVTCDRTERRLMLGLGDDRPQ